MGVREGIEAYDPWDPDVLADPYPYYRWLREEAPCYRNPELEIYVLSRYEDVNAALRDHARFSSADGPCRQPRGGFTFIDEDPPEHTRTRRTATRPFTRRGVERMRGTVEELASTLVGEAVSRGEVDAVAELADPLTTDVLAGFLGIPDPDPTAWLSLSEATFQTVSAKDDADVPEDLEERQLAVGRHIDEVVEDRKRSGTSSGPGDLVDAVIERAEPDEDGFRLDRLGRATYVTSLVPPGLETTRHLVGNALELAARYPDEWRRVVEGEVDPAAFVEEVLRFESPIQGFFRGTTEDVEIGGTIPSGARVLCLYASANRDEKVFERGDRFDPGRQPAEHLAFGAGIHYCLGASLARMEATAVVSVLGRARASVERTGPGRRAGEALLRGWWELPVRLRAAAD